MRFAGGEKQSGLEAVGAVGRRNTGTAIRFWPVQVGDAPSLLLGPIAVHPTRQGEGLGGYLIEQSLARATDWTRVMLVGDAPYYGRYGFEKLPDVIMPPPTNPDRVLGRALQPGAWAGISGRVHRWRPDPPRPFISSQIRPPEA